MTNQHAHQLNVADVEVVSDLAMQLVGGLKTWPGHVEQGADAIPAGRQLLSVQRALFRHGASLPIVEYHMRNLEGDAASGLFDKTSAWALCLPDGRQVDASGNCSADKILAAARAQAGWPGSAFAIMSSPTDATKLCEGIAGFMREQAAELDACMARQALFLVLDHATAQAKGPPRSPRL